MVKRNIAVVGESLKAECISTLETLGYEVVVLPRDNRLGVGVDTHTDLLVFPLGDLFFTYGGAVSDVLESKGIKTVKIYETPKGEYPYDVYLNGLTVGKYIFARRKYFSHDAVAEAEKRGYTVIDVRQGYARCTACPIDDRAVITADPSILKAAEAVGIEALSVSVGGVELVGYPYGFIGGACGVDRDRVFFAGDIYTHPDGEQIVDFCQKRGKEVISLCNGSLSDVGSIYFCQV